MGLFDFFHKKDDITREIDEIHARSNKAPAFTNFDTRTNAVFLIDDIFNITGRGVVVTGTVKQGTFQSGDKIELEKQDGSILPCTIKGLEMFRKILSSATVGDNVGILLSGVGKLDVRPGDRLCKRV